MGPNVIRGLPAHILLVHLIVILVPAAAAAVLTAAWWPRGRRWLGMAPSLLALAALVMVPVTTQAGKWLRERVAPTPLIARHAHLGDQLLPWVIGLFAVSVLAWFVGRRLDRAHGSFRARDTTESRLRVLGVALALAASVASVGAVVQTIRIGESGSKAVWHGNFSDQPR